MWKASILVGLVGLILATTIAIAVETGGRGSDDSGDDPTRNPAGVKISDTELAAVPLTPPRFPRRMELHHHRAIRPVVSR
jgi:hypothetical protein